MRLLKPGFVWLKGIMVLNNKNLPELFKLKITGFEIIRYSLEL